MTKRYYSSTRSNAARKIAATQIGRPCSICGRAVLDTHRWQADHVVPRVLAEQQGWTRTEIDSPSNIAIAHASCNMQSGAKLGNVHRAQAKAQPRKVPQVKRPQLSFSDGALPSPGGALQILSPAAEAGTQEAHNGP